MTENKKEFLNDRHEVEQAIIDRAADDAAFRAQLVADPRGTVAEYINGPVPETADIRVFEEPQGSVYLVLPHLPVTEGAELTEDMLEAVAGGDWVELLWTSICWGDGDGPAPDTSPPAIDL